jgi:hypothetical protein
MMTRSFAALLLAALPLAGARAASWDAASRPLTGLVRTSFDFGGTAVARADLAPAGSLDPPERHTLRAGQLITLSGGALLRGGGPWSVEATAGYKLDKLSAGGKTAWFTRLPLDLLVSVGGAHRLGLGATLHLAPQVRCSGDATCSWTRTYPAAAGGVLQYAWRSGETYGLEAGGRLTWLKYRGAGLPTLDANTLGVFVGVWL